MDTWIVTHGLCVVMHGGGLRGGDNSFLLLSMFASRACLQRLSTGTLDRGASK